MEKILEMAARGFEQMIGRVSGPLNFRLFVMPTVVTILAIRAGLRDAREGQPPFLRAILTSASQRRRLFHTGLKDVGKIFIVALVLDSGYQLFVMREFHVVQSLFVAVACAIVPYVLIRPITRMVRSRYSKPTSTDNKPVAETIPNPIQKRV